MFKRKIEKQLEDWFKSDDKKCLIVNGARQVGKTFIIKHLVNAITKMLWNLIL